MQIRYILSLFCCLLLAQGISQKKITLEDCFRDFKFYPASIEGFEFLQQSRKYTQLDGNDLHLRDIESEQFDSVLWRIPATIGVADYSLSKNEQTLLVISDRQPVYRHSFLAQYFALLNASNKAIPIGGKNAVLQLCKLSPDGQKALFIKENNLYVQELGSGAITQITKDGEKNKIINGLPDWVYEEEFSPVDGAGMVAVEWSPDSKSIGFIRFDESEVPEFKMTKYTGAMYPEIVQFKYPKVGSANAKVTAHLYDTKTGRTKKVYTGQEGDRYLPRIHWTPNNRFVAVRLNRHQDSLQMFICTPDFDQDVDVLDTKVLLTITDSAYVEMLHHDFLYFMKDNQHFIYASETTGACKLYLFDMNGKVVRQLTSGREEVTAFYGIDEEKKLFYIQTTYSPLLRMVWEMPFEGGESRIMTGESEGYHEAGFSPGFDYWVHKSQTALVAPVYTLRRRDGSVVKTLLDNQQAMQMRKAYGFTDKEFFQIPINKDQKMNAWMIKPPNFDLNKEYPVLIDIYGGPGSQTVTYEYDGYLDPWRQMLAQEGYIVMSIDNRGTGGRGRKFKKVTQLKLGEIETKDQIVAAKYLTQVPFVDSARIGIWGWSYGGYLSTSCILKGADVYKMAVAVAPVTNWKWYDSAYTERYMHTTAENAKGYEDNSPVNFADKLKGNNYLLCHGIADDNVHWQHAVEMTDALIKAGKQFDTYYYPNRNHGIYGDNATIHVFTKITNFVREKL